MNNYSNMNNEAVDQSSSESYAPKKSYINKIMIAILSLVLSFAIWCLAEYQSDPIIAKKVVIEFKLTNGQTGEQLIPNINGKDMDKKSIILELYGKESILKDLHMITYPVDRYIKYRNGELVFENYNEYVAIPLNTDYDGDGQEDYEIHDKIVFKLVGNDTSSGK